MAPICPLQALATARQTEENNKSTPFFTKLLPEIRLMIYDQLFANEQYLVYPAIPVSRNAHITSILQTSHQMRREALPHFHRKINMTLVGEKGTKAFLGRNNEVIDRRRIERIKTIFSGPPMPREVQSLVCCLNIRSLKIRRREIVLREDKIHELAKERLPDLKNDTFKRVLSKGPRIWGRYAPRDALAYSVMKRCLAAWRADFSVGMLRCGTVTSMNMECQIEYECVVSISIGQDKARVGTLTYKFPSRVVEWRVLGRAMTTILPIDNRPQLPTGQGYTWAPR